MVLFWSGLRTRLHDGLPILVEASEGQYIAF